MTDQDRELMRKIANATDALKRDCQRLSQRVDHLEAHLHADGLEPTRNLRCTVAFCTSVPPTNHAACLAQFQAELVSLFREHGACNFEGTYAPQ